ncbi:MAG TPA: 3-oxoacyl-[acyl-carrier-protein] synthase III C-terminal domain-containing protein [Acidimicrobiia bacterium]|nr:3-oxoacyl-[acyl-carrier-protein] synthase III C-terminal domain-containing protein [Acidimicrobiia bacterium]
MDGGGLYRMAVRLMPETAEALATSSGIAIEDIDVLVAHQANDRILEGVRHRLGMRPEQVPSNIANYGNTTAATLPILFHELRGAGRVSPGHWSALPPSGRAPTTAQPCTGCRPIRSPESLRPP